MLWWSRGRLQNIASIVHSYILTLWRDSLESDYIRSSYDVSHMSSLDDVWNNRVLYIDTHTLLWSYRGHHPTILSPLVTIPAHRTQPTFRVPQLRYFIQILKLLVLPVSHCITNQCDKRGPGDAIGCCPPIHAAEYLGYAPSNYENCVSSVGHLKHIITKFGTTASELCSHQFPDVGISGAVNLRQMFLAFACKTESGNLYNKRTQAERLLLTLWHPSGLNCYALLISQEKHKGTYLRTCIYILAVTIYIWCPSEAWSRRQREHCLLSVCLCVSLPIFTVARRTCRVIAEDYVGTHRLAVCHWLYAITLDTIIMNRPSLKKYGAVKLNTVNYVDIYFTEWLTNCDAWQIDWINQLFIVIRLCAYVKPLADVLPTDPSSMTSNQPREMHKGMFLRPRVLRPRYHVICEEASQSF